MQRCSQYSVCRSNPARRNAAQPVATDHSSLPWATARCNLCSDRNAVSPVATDHSPLQPVAAMIATQCDPLQQTSSATGCNAVPFVATDRRLLQPVAAFATQCRPLTTERSPLLVCDALRGVPGLRGAGVRLLVAQPVATQPPRPVRAVAPSYPMGYSKYSHLGTSVRRHTHHGPHERRLPRVSSGRSATLALN